MSKIISTGYQIYNPDSFCQSSPSNDSPQLLCSGAVLRYQFKPYPMPDRTYPPSVKLVTYWHRVVATQCSKGTRHIRLWLIYQAVVRGGSYTQRQQKWRNNMTLALVETQTTIGINEEALAEWIDYRTEDLKKPMTPRAIKMVRKKLFQWSEAEQERMIEHAIEHNWRGIYWVEAPKQATTRQSDIYDELFDRSWA